MVVAWVRGAIGVILRFDFDILIITAAVRWATRS